MKTEIFRGFVALPLPSEIKIFLERFITQAKPVFPDCRFVSVKNLHITLQFLGNNVQRSLIPCMLDVIQASATETAPFTLSLGKPLTFPYRGRPRVFHIGIDKSKHELIDLAGNLRTGLGSLGFEENRPFQPHITLARNKGRGKRQKGSCNQRMLWEQSFRAFRNKYLESKSTASANLRWDVSEVLLMESKLYPQGPYTILGSVQLPPE